MASSVDKSTMPTVPRTSTPIRSPDGDNAVVIRLDVRIGSTFRHSPGELLHAAGAHCPCNHQFLVRPSPRWWKLMSGPTQAIIACASLYGGSCGSQSFPMHVALWSGMEIMKPDSVSLVIQADRVSNPTGKVTRYACEQPSNSLVEPLQLPKTFVICGDVAMAFHRDAYDSAGFGARLGRF